jgi:ABC-type nitrate/sulfonate/bicarbonate transport system ATPase subunit
MEILENYAGLRRSLSVHQSVSSQSRRGETEFFYYEVLMGFQLPYHHVYIYTHIGDSAVGKSSILMRLKKGLEAPFEENVESTIGGMLRWNWNVCVCVETKESFHLMDDNFSKFTFI